MTLSFVPINEKNRLVAKVASYGDLQTHVKALQQLSAAPAAISTNDGHFVSVRGNRADHVTKAGHDILNLEPTHEHYKCYEHAAHAIEARGEGQTLSGI